MINVPVHKSDDYDDEFIYDVDIFDKNGDYICLSANESTADELIKIINGHHELIKALKDMVEIVGSNFCSNKDTKSAYRNARELLERLK